MSTLGKHGQALGAEIGKQVRRLRKKAGLSGVELATAAGVSQPFLSQLESGRTSVSIATLYRIARALEVHPSDLLPSPNGHEIEVVRSEDKQRIALSERLGTATARAVFRGGARISEFYDYELSTDDYIADWFSSDAEHALYVLEGSLRVEFENQPEILLEAGDVVFYNSQLPHRWHTVPGQRARIIIVVANF